MPNVLIGARFNSAPDSRLARRDPGSPALKNVAAAAKVLWSVYSLADPIQFKTRDFCGARRRQSSCASITIFSIQECWSMTLPIAMARSALWHNLKESFYSPSPKRRSGFTKNGSSKRTFDDKRG